MTRPDSQLGTAMRNNPLIENWLDVSVQVRLNTTVVSSLIRLLRLACAMARILVWNLLAFKSPTYNLERD